ncbi:MAG: glycosyltransferase family 2 protein [Bacteroidaceae bacterium]|nr:glycosyltransferase family 2 protein [Bacteroidaceae bacterium]
MEHTDISCGSTNMLHASSKERMAQPILSVLIPTFHFSPERLVSALSQQARSVGDVEIIVVDDGSSDEALRQQTIALERFASVYVFALQENIGRARVRNLLYRLAKSDLMLFIDSDAEVVADDFLAAYLVAASQADVVCGRLTNLPPPAPKGCELRYRYETAAERAGKRAAHWRNQHPYAHLSTFQLLVHRRVMERVQFDEHIREYGYEDVLFGLRLQEEEFRVLHIDTPLLHTGIDSNAHFLAHIEAAIRILAGLPPTVQQQIALSRLALRLRAWHVAGMARAIFRLLKPLIRRQLMSSRPSLILFQTYKLGYLLALDAK